MGVTLGIGTVKGAWFATSEDREDWEVSGPHLKGWEVSTLGRAPGGDYLLATASTWYGAALHRSADCESWSQIVSGPSYPGGEDRKLQRIWTIAGANGLLYAGVADAGLFRSSDDGETWHPVAGLNHHATRPGWSPGLGGLMAHRILTDPAEPGRMWCAISAVGVFRTEDGGATWVPRNDGVDLAEPDNDYPEIGYCVHSLAHDPDDPRTIWRQDHRGVYRTTTGGDSWERIQAGLPNESGFGFPIVRHHATGALFIVPLESDEYRMPVAGQLRVFRSTDRGDSWHVSGKGWSDASTYSGVLRDAMDCDQLEPGGVYFGTTSGTLGYTIDGGETWRTLAPTLPRILSVRVLDR
jgi:photosystem II stability/assembly factor-like uncharacterized protein